MSNELISAARAEAISQVNDLRHAVLQSDDYAILDAAGTRAMAWVAENSVEAPTVAAVAYANHLIGKVIDAPENAVPLFKQFRQAAADLEEARAGLTMELRRLEASPAE